MHNKVKLAILSPAENNYSETFVKAHKEMIDADVLYYYRGSVPTMLEGEGALLTFNFMDRVRRKLDVGLGPKSLDDTEKALFRSLKQNRVDIILAEFGTTAAKCYNVLKATEIPLIVHFHGYDAHQKNVVEENLDNYKKTFEYASAIIAVSNFMKQTLIDLGADVSKIVVNPCGPAESFFEIDRSKNRNVNDLLFVGRFVDKKSPIDLIKAFDLIKQAHPEAKLTMVGDGPLLEASKDLAKQFKLNGSIEFAGRKSHQEILSLMQSAFCYVQHSRIANNGDSEGTPVAVMEAAAAGLPVVSTRHAGISDVILHEETGLLVEEGDYNEMAKCVMSLLENPDRAQAMGKASRENMKSNYSQKISVEVIDRLIKDALHG